MIELKSNIDGIRNEKNSISINTVTIKEENQYEKLDNKLESDDLFIIKSRSKPLFNTLLAENVKKNIKHAHLIVKSYSKPFTKPMP